MDICVAGGALALVSTLYVMAVILGRPKAAKIAAAAVTVTAADVAGAKVSPTAPRPR
jgi:hypothetical protein